MKQIHFLLAQCTTESCPILKNLGNITKLLTNIQKKWLKFYLKELKLLKDRNVYEVVDLSLRDRKQLRIARYSILSLIVITDLNLLQKNFFRLIKKLTLMNILFICLL